MKNNRSVMNRRKFLQSAGLGAAALAGAGLIGSGVAYAKPNEWFTVTNGTATEIKNAVDTYDKVLLKGTSNFAPGESVEINTSVMLRGNKATIIGGTDVFFINAPGKGISIEGIGFSSAIGCAVNVRKCASAVVQGNTISNVLMDNGFAAGIWVNAQNNADLGEVNVLNNTISHIQATETGTNFFKDAAGVWVGQIVGMSPTTTVNIQGNTISDAGNSGVNIQGTPGAFVNVIGNTITATEYAYGVQDSVTPNKFGLRLVSGGISTLYDGEYNPGPAYIANNILRNMYGVGMVIDCLENSIIENNDIHMAKPSSLAYNLRYHVAFNLCYGNIPNAALGMPANSGDPGVDFAYTTNNQFLMNRVSGTAKCVFRVSEGSKCNLFQANVWDGLVLYPDSLFGPAGFEYYFTDGTIDPANDKSINNEVRGKAQYVHEDSPGYNLINGVGDYYDGSDCTA